VLQHRAFARHASDMPPIPGNTEQTIHQSSARPLTIPVYMRICEGNATDRLDMRRNCGQPCIVLSDVESLETRLPHGSIQLDHGF
jgi:hypothetical protein